jgi:hypothetical protein
VTGDDSPPAVFSVHAMAVDHIKLFALAPKPEKILGVALTIGVNLKDIRNTTPTGFMVTGKAALPVASVGLIENLKAGSELFP